MKTIEVGTRVVALRQLVEADEEPNPAAEPGESGFVHAEKGDEGVVEDIDTVTPVGELDAEPEALVLVRFDRTASATMCFVDEVDPVV